jgi:hypothetical protein
MKLKNLLTEAESFTATNKKTGKTSVFKSKDSRDSAIKAGTHDKVGGDGDSKKSAKGGVNIFDKPKVEPNAKDTAKSDGMETVNSIAANTGLRATAVAGWSDENGVNLSKVSDALKSKKLKPMDFMTAVSGNPGNKYAKDIIKKYSNAGASKSEPKEEPKADTPVAKPKEARKGNPQVNVAAKKTAEKYGITPQKLGNEKYKEAMFQAAVSALTDSNFHGEARELVAAIEGKPELAKRPEYPSMDDPKYKEKMADIRKNSADGSVYMNGTGDVDDYGTDVSQASGWDGVDAADGIAFTLRMNGFHKEADMIQSVFNDKPYMKESRTSLKSIMRK